MQSAILTASTWLASLTSSIALVATAPDPEGTGPEVQHRSAVPITITEDEVAEPVVERPSAGIIRIEGATYGIVRPDAPVISGVPIPLASMAWQTTDGEPLVWAVDSRVDYEVKTCVFYLPDGEDDPTLVQAKFFTVEVPRTRADKIQRLLEIGFEQAELEIELGDIDFFEMVAAFRRWQAEQQTDGTIKTGLEASIEHKRMVDEFHEQARLKREQREQEREQKEAADGSDE